MPWGSSSKGRPRKEKCGPMRVHQKANLYYTGFCQRDSLGLSFGKAGGNMIVIFFVLFWGHTKQCSELTLSGA